MRSKFDEQLALLNRDLTKMGSLCEEALALAAKALATAAASCERFKTDLSST